jgi:2-oxo-4-hydroxy-4-carboxy-5-ureidoimidazoline decarboxylase
MGETMWTIAEVNSWDRETFVRRLGFLFEQSPWIVDAAYGSRPFASCETLHQALVAVVTNAPVEQQVALIQAHPDLVGRAALAGTLTRESTSEQRAAGLDPGRLTPDEIARFEELNASYQTRFGFPFVICARDNTKASIMSAFTARVTNDRSTEIATALTEIVNICWYRLNDVVNCSL